jgi:hypothetical protein
MEHPPLPDPADPRLLAIYPHAITTLRQILPRPIPDTPEAWAHRDRIALAAFSALAPANHAEASMAVLQIATVAQAGECLRLAAEHAAEPKIAARLHRQTEMMEREAHRSLKFLRTVQKARAKREADPVTRDADNALQQRLLATMTAALEHVQSEALRPAPAPEPDRHAPSRTSDRAEGADPRGENIIVWPKVPTTKTVH